MYDSKLCTAEYPNPVYCCLVVLPGAFPANRFSNYMTSTTSVDINLKSKEMVILGTQYAGEMKKGVFRYCTLLTWLTWSGAVHITFIVLSPAWL